MSEVPDRGMHPNRRMQDYENEMCESCGHTKRMCADMDECSYSFSARASLDEKSNPEPMTPKDVLLDTASKIGPVTMDPKTGVHTLDLSNHPFFK